MQITVPAVEASTTRFEAVNFDENGINIVESRLKIVAELAECVYIM